VVTATVTPDDGIAPSVTSVTVSTALINDPFVVSPGTYTVTVNFDEDMDDTGAANPWTYTN